MTVNRSSEALDVLIRVRMPRAMYIELCRLARDSEQTVSAKVRSLVSRAAAPVPAEQALLPAVGALVTAEQILLVLGSMFPEGDRRVREQAERAVEAAERRLAQLTDRLAEERRIGA